MTEQMPCGVSNNRTSFDNTKSKQNTDTYGLTKKIVPTAGKQFQGVTDLVSSFILECLKKENVRRHR